MAFHHVFRHPGQYGRSGLPSFPPVTLEPSSPPGPIPSSTTILVKWKDFGRQVANAFTVLFYTHEEDGDVTIVCGGEFIKAHKIVLTVGSTYFRETFKMVPAKHPMVLLKGIRATIMKSILRCLYLGEVIVDKADMPKFKEGCEELGMFVHCGDLQFYDPITGEQLSSLSAPATATHAGFTMSTASHNPRNLLIETPPLDLTSYVRSGIVNKSCIVDSSKGNPERPPPCVYHAHLFDEYSHHHHHHPSSHQEHQDSPIFSKQVGRTSGGQCIVARDPSCPTSN